MVGGGGHQSKKERTDYVIEADNIYEQNIMINTNYDKY